MASRAHLKDVGEVEEGLPGLVDDVEAHGARCLVDVGVKDLVCEPDRRRLEGVVGRQLDLDLRRAALASLAAPGAPLPVPLYHCTDAN